MTHSIRTFIAIKLDEEIQQIIEIIQDHFKQFDRNIKWVKPENIHLTLKFLSDIETKQIKSISTALQTIASHTHSINTELTQLGTFPPTKHPRVIWMGLRDDQKKIEQMAQAIENELSRCGFNKEKRGFSPHITIGRVRTSKNISLLSQEMKKYSLPAGICQSIQNIIFFKSTLTPTGPIYDVLASFQLKK